MSVTATSIMATGIGLNVTRYNREVDQAVSRMERAREGLYVRPGEPLYSPEIMREREEMLLREFDAALEAIDTKAQADLIRCQQTLERGPRDPLMRLTSTDLARAEQLRGFVTDEAKTPSAFLSGAESAIADGDTPAMAVYLRVARMQMKERSDLVRRAGRLPVPDDWAELAAITQRLEDELADPKEAVEREELQAAQRMVAEVVGRVRSTRSQAHGWAEQARSSQLKALKDAF